MKPGRRPDLGEQRTPGEYRPVTNRSLVFIGLGVVLLAAAATVAILVASAGTKTQRPPATNVPTQKVTSSPTSSRAFVLRSNAALLRSGTQRRI